MEKKNYRSSDVLKRSVFGLAHCYNALPQSTADKTSVKDFQKALQDALTKLAAARTEDWQKLYPVGWRRYTRLNLDRLFS